MSDDRRLPGDLEGSVGSLVASLQVSVETLETYQTDDDVVRELKDVLAEIRALTIG